MARGAERKVTSANGSVRTREMARKTRHMVKRGIEEDRENLIEQEKEIYKNSNKVRSTKDKVLTKLALPCKDDPLDVVQYSKSNSPLYQTLTTTTTTCVITRTSSQVLSNGGQFIESESRKKDEEPLLHLCSNIPVSSEDTNQTETPQCSSETVRSNTKECCSDKIDTSTWRMELALHLNTIVYMIFSLSTVQFLKVASEDTKRSPLILDPLILKIFCTFFVGIAADLASPVMALAIPQVICLFAGVLSNLKILPELLAFVVCYLPQLNSGLVGTQLLMRLCKPSENFAAALARLNCVFCLMDICSPGVLKILTLQFGYSLSYQVLAFCSFLGIVGVLYLFHTNKTKHVCTPGEMSVIKSCLTRILVSIPIALLLPQFQYIIGSFSHINKAKIAGRVAVGLVLQQAVTVPLLQKFFTPRKIICAFTSLLALLCMSMIILEMPTVRLLLFILILAVAGVLQNFAVSFLVTSYPKIPGILISTNIVIHILVRFYAMQVTKDMRILPVLEEKCSYASLWLQSFAKNVFPEQTSGSLFGSTIFHCDNIYMNSIYVLSSLAAVILLVISSII